MKLNELDKLINETLYNEVKKSIINESENKKEVYHIMCDGEPIATFNTIEDAKEELPKYKKSLPDDKELIIEKGVYESYSDMLEKLDELGGQLEEDKDLEIKEQKTMKKSNKNLSKKRTNMMEEEECTECGDKSIQELFGDDSFNDETEYEEDDDLPLELTPSKKDKDLKHFGIKDDERVKSESNYDFVFDKKDELDTDDDDIDDEYNTEEGMMDPELSDDPDELTENNLPDYQIIYNKLKSNLTKDEVDEESNKHVCSECGGMLNEEGMCNECGYGQMKESELCSECGGMLNEEGMCNECGMGLGMAESKKKTIKLTESKLVELISKMVTEAMKGEPGVPGIPGVFNTKKAQGASKKFNDDNIKLVDKKMKDYLSFEGNSNSEFPHQNNGDVMAIHNTEEQDEEVARNLAGLQNLDYDTEPSEKFKERMKMSIEGDSKMGNGSTTGKQTIKPSNDADKGLEAKEEIGNVVNSKKAIKKINKQIKDRGEDKKNRVLYNKEKVPVKNTVNESENTKNNILNEELDRIKNLSSYNKKTQ